MNLLNLQIFNFYYEIFKKKLKYIIYFLIILNKIKNLKIVYIYKLLIKLIITILKFRIF